MSKLIRVGDRVSYSSNFLKSIQEHDLAWRRGTVAEVASISGRIFATVDWSMPGGAEGKALQLILASNLVQVDRMHLEAA